MDSKLLNGIKSMNVNSLAYIRVTECESEYFRIDSGVRHGCIMSPWLFNAYMDTVMKEVKMGIGRKGKSRDCRASCMQMNLVCVASRRKT